MTDAQVRARGAQIAVAYYEEHGRPGSWMRYGMYRPMPDGLYSDEALAGGRIDCSTFATLVFKAAGAPDPNGRAYSGEGWTGTLWNNGAAATGAPRALDLALYGDVYATSGHVAVVINADEVISFGHTPIERYPIKYRSDFKGIRRYEVVEPEPLRYWLEELPWPAGGHGPKVNGPWLDERDIADKKKWPAVRRLADRMNAAGKLAQLVTRGNRAWILEYLPGTYGQTVRYGSWSSEDDWRAARPVLEKRLGRRLRPYVGRANTYYPVI